MQLELFPELRKPPTLSKKLNSFFGLIAYRTEGELGYCNMRNDTFINKEIESPYFGKSHRSVQRGIQKLIDAGLILVEFRTKNKLERKIHLTQMGKEYRAYYVAKKLDVAPKQISDTPRKLNVAPKRRTLTELNSNLTKCLTTRPKKVKPSLQENRLPSQIQPQATSMDNETRLDIGYEQRNIDWNERDRIQKEQEMVKAEWKRKDEIYGRYLFQKTTGTTEEQWRASLVKAGISVEEFEDIKREWEGREAV